MRIYIQARVLICYTARLKVQSISLFEGIDDASRYDFRKPHLYLADNLCSVFDLVWKGSRGSSLYGVVPDLLVLQVISKEPA